MGEYFHGHHQDISGYKICGATDLDVMQYKNMILAMNQIYESWLNLTIWKYDRDRVNFQKFMKVNANFSLQMYTDLPDSNTTIGTTFSIDDFHNKTIRICTLIYEPFFQFKHPNASHHIDNAIGFIAKIVSYLAERLHFQPEIYVRSDGKYGTKIDNETIYSGCVGDVQSQIAELAAGIFTYTNERNEVIDFTYPINSDPTTIIFHRPIAVAKWWNVFQSLQISIWFLLFGCTTFVALCMTAFCRYNPLSAWNLKLPFAIKDEIQLSEHFWAAVGSFMMQGQDFYAYSLSSRFVLALWWIFSVIILSVFSADLTSMLTLNLNAPYPRTLTELSQHEEIILYLSDAVSSTYTIQNSEDTILKKIASRSIVINNCYDKLLDPNENNIACAVEQSGATSLMAQNCSRYYVLDEIIQPSYNGFIIPKNANYKDIINKRIQMLVDSGVIEKWFMEDIKRYGQSFCENPNDRIDPINMDSFLGICILCFSVFVAGIVVLIVELLLAKWFM